MTRIKKVAKIKKKIVFYFLAALLLLLIFIKIYNALRPYSWTTFVSDGSIQSKFIKKDNTLIFGTNYSKLYFLDTNDSTKVKNIDLNTGIANPQQLDGDNLLVISDDTLRYMGIKNKKVIWQVSTGNETFFETAKIYKNFVLAGSADGTLSAYRVTDGKYLWKFTPNELKDLSSVIYGGNIHYFGGFEISNDKIFLASHDKTFYSINLKDGSVVWKQNINEMMNADINIYENYIYLTTNSGKSLALDKRDGKIIWSNTSDSPILCSNLITNLIVSDIPQIQIITDIKQQILKIFSRENIEFFELHENGTFEKRDGRTGVVLWKSQEFGKGTNCPKFWRSEAVLTGSNGSLTAISLNSGKVIYSRTDLGKIINPVIVESRLFGILPDWLNFVSARIYVKNIDGLLRLIDSSTGKTIWEFSANAPSDLDMFVDQKNAFLATTDGVIYKLNKKSGRPDLSSRDKKFSISVGSTRVAGSKIFEISLKSDGIFTNPWREADIQATFISESGRIVTIPGFYYDQNVWKIRFNPPLKGTWTWKVAWTPHGSTFYDSGQLVSPTDTSNFYIRTNEKYPKALSLDGVNIFNGLGLGDSMFDYNFNGTPLDDWAMGNSSPVTATSSSGFISRYNSNVINSLDDYISAYGPNGGGFNVFRWSLMNGSQSLYTNLGFPTTYSILQGKIGDRFAETLRKNDIHLWFTIFGFDIPNKYSNDNVDRYILKSYIRYLFARYGVYTDVWELANEVAIPKDIAKFLKDEIAALDYEHRPISISSDPYNLTDSDVIAPHWYDSEDITRSESDTVQEIKKYGNINKPLVFAEQGNRLVNYDATSAIRMRVRLWTAFFNRAILMFWNQSDTKDHKVGVFPANQYLGTEERGYTKIFQNLTKSFPLASIPLEFHLENFGVRGYGFSSDNLVAAYFYHFGSPLTDTSIVTTVWTKGGPATWVDPATGKVLAENYCPQGNCRLESPTFKTDLLLFVKKQ